MSVILVFKFIYIMSSRRIINFVVFKSRMGVHLYEMYYAVTYFHCVLFMAAVFFMFKKVYYWLDKLQSIRCSKILVLTYFWAFFISVNLTFLSIGWVLRVCLEVLDYSDAFYLFNKTSFWKFYIPAVLFVLFFVVVAKVCFIIINLFKFFLPPL